MITLELLRLAPFDGRFDQPTALPDGTVVRIFVGSDTPMPTLAERLKDVIGIAPGLPSDLAENHDHYLHGKPKH